MSFRFQDYLNAVFSGLWIEERDLSQPESLVEVLGNAGFDPQSVFSLCNEPAVKDKLKSNTEEAVARGVFGAHLFVAKNDLWPGSVGFCGKITAVKVGEDPLASRSSRGGFSGL